MKGLHLTLLFCVNCIPNHRMQKNGSKEYGSVLRSRNRVLASIRNSNPAQRRKRPWGKRDHRRRLISIKQYLSERLLQHCGEKNSQVEIVPMWEKKGPSCLQPPRVRTIGSTYLHCRSVLKSSGRKTRPDAKDTMLRIVKEGLRDRRNTTLFTRKKEMRTATSITRSIARN